MPQESDKFGPSERIKLLEESSTLRMSRLSRELRAEGKTVINLSLGEPDFQTPDHIRSAAVEAVQQGWSHYPPVAGYPELREAISAKLERENGLHFTPSQIVVSTGAKQSTYNLLLCLLNPGDEALILSPYWVSYPEILKLAGAVPNYLYAGPEQDYKVKAIDLERAITPKTKLVLLNSPNNPTGAVYSDRELEGLAKVLGKYPHVFVISDEIYEHITFNGKVKSIASYPELEGRVAIINGLSKAYAMTGWRLGYTASPEWLAKACEKLQGQVTSGASSITQRAALAALGSNLGPTLAMRDQFKERRDVVYQLLCDIPDVKCPLPDGAFYLFPDVSAYYGRRNGDDTIKDGEDLCMYLLSTTGVALVSGDGFGDPNAIRISYAASLESLQNAMALVKDALAKLI